MKRTQYLGSSDAREIAMGHYNAVYAAKANGEEKDFSDNFKVQFGAYVEPFHLRWITHHQHRDWDFSQGVPTEHGDGSVSDVQHFKTHKLSTELGNLMTLGSHPDALIETPDGRQYPCEVKHSGTFRTIEEATYFYAASLQHHMICWGTDRLFFSLIFGNEEPVGTWVGYSREFVEWYIPRACKAWDYIATQTPPPIDPEFSMGNGVPKKVQSTVPLNGMKIRYTGPENNTLTTLIADHNDLKPKAKRFDEVKKELRETIADDESQVVFEDDGKEIFNIKRNKAGVPRLTIKDEDYGTET